MWCSLFGCRVVYFCDRFIRKKIGVGSPHLLTCVPFSRVRKNPAEIFLIEFDSSIQPR